MRFVYYYRGLPELTQAVHIGAMVEALRGLGHEVEPIFPVAMAPEAARSPSSLARLLGGVRGCLPRPVWDLLRLGADWRTARTLRARLSALRPEVIYERYVPLGGRCSRLAAEFRIPYLLEVNETARLIADRLSPATARRAFRVEDEVLARAGKVIAVSAVLRDHLVSLGVAPERVTVMHNGIHADRFARAAEERPRTRAKLGLEGSFAIGCLQSWHGVEGLYAEMLAVLTQLARRLPSRVPSAVLVMIGGGTALEEVKRRMGEAAGGQQIRFTGPVAHAEVPALLAGLDAGLVVHHSDFTSPLKVFEYMAAGAVCLACDRPNLREMIEENETGRFFPPKDVDALLEVIADLAADPARREQLARAGREKALRDHTWEANARGVVALATELQRKTARDGRGAGELRAARSNSDSPAMH